MQVRRNKFKTNKSQFSKSELKALATYSEKLLLDNKIPHVALSKDQNIVAKNKGIRLRAQLSTFENDYCDTLGKFPFLENVFEKVKNTYPTYDLNSVQINVYKGKGKYIDWHSDNNPVYPKDKGIIILSLGDTAKMGIRGINKKLQNKITMRNGTLLEMKPFSQEKTQHCIFKENKSISRVSLVFRNLNLDKI